MGNNNKNTFTYYCLTKILKYTKLHNFSDRACPLCSSVWVPDDPVTHNKLMTSDSFRSTGVGLFAEPFEL